MPNTEHRTLFTRILEALAGMVRRYPETPGSYTPEGSAARAAIHQAASNPTIYSECLAALARIDAMLNGAADPQPIKSQHPYNQKPETATCGCCTNGCVCWIHQDIPHGVMPFICLYHSLKPIHEHTRAAEFTSQNRVTTALQTARNLILEAMSEHIYNPGSGEESAPDCHYAACVAEIDAILQTTVAPEPLSDRAALQSILAWTEDSTDPAPMVLLQIRNAARTALQNNPTVKPFYCPLCGQHIKDGKPCGCGAR